MKNSIVKTFIGKHIDLTKIVAISDAEFIGAYKGVIGFEIYIQLLDKPIEYVRDINEINIEEYRLSANYREDNFNTFALKSLQKQIDELIVQWKAVNNE